VNERLLPALAPEVQQETTPDFPLNLELAQPAIVEDVEAETAFLAAVAARRASRPSPAAAEPPPARQEPAPAPTSAAPSTCGPAARHAKPAKRS